ncbi:hypothetical protein ACWEF6_09280 [Amycolatopsis sp. NPDC004772]
MPLSATGRVSAFEPGKETDATEETVTKVHLDRQPDSRRSDHRRAGQCPAVRAVFMVSRHHGHRGGREVIAEAGGTSR